MSFTPGAPTRWRDVYLCAIARAMSTCGDFLAATALVLGLQARGAGGLAVAAVLLAAAVPSAALAPLTGRLVDRVDSRVLVVTTSLAQAGICLGLAYAHGVVAIVALVATLAAGLAITQPALGALVPDMVGRDNLPRAVAIGQTATSVGIMAAPALSGLLVGAFGLRVPLLIDAASYLALAVAGLALRTRRGGAPPPVGPGEVPTLPARWSLRQDTLLWSLLVLLAAVVGAVSAVNTVEVFFVRGTLHASTTVFGLLATAWAGAMMLSGWLIARRRMTDPWLGRATLYLLFLTSGAILAAAAVPSVGWLVPLWVLGGLSNGGENAAVSILLGRRVPAAVRGRAMAVFSGTINGAGAGGLLLGGALLPLVSPRPLIAATGLFGLLVVAAGVVPVLRGVGRRTVENHEPTATAPGRTHPVPELPADLLGTDALGGTAGPGPVQGHAGPAEQRAGRG